jgi:hypothetical protein
MNRATGSTSLLCNRSIGQTASRRSDLRYHLGAGSRSLVSLKSCLQDHTGQKLSVGRSPELMLAEDHSYRVVVGAPEMDNMTQLLIHRKCPGRSSIGAARAVSRPAGDLVDYVVGVQVVRVAKQ